MVDTEVRELNEAGEIIRKLVLTSNEHSKQTRVDFIQPESSTTSYLQTILDVFLPAGFPNSVTNDYVEYQIYDSLQAFASSIAGLLSSRAVLSSLGVGNATSTATAAVVLNVLQETLGRLSTILFAHLYGTIIEPECKMYRLLADILNDCAFVLDCLSPALPQIIRVLALTSAGVLRALCGVAAGSSKASLSAHFARRGNLAELNAKDSSQETIISLLGMLCGTLVVTSITGPVATWTTLMLLLAMHLELNRRAVRAVAMTTMNRQRAGLVYHHLVRGNIPTPQDIAKEERIFAPGNALYNSSQQYIGHCVIGVSLHRYFATLGTLTSTGAANISSSATANLFKPFSAVRHVLWYDVSSLSEKIAVSIALQDGATTRDQIIAWWHATSIACNIRRMTSVDAHQLSEKNEPETILQSSLREALLLMQTNESALQKAGWDIAGSKLETGPGIRWSLNDDAR